MYLRKTVGFSLIEPCVKPPAIWADISRKIPLRWNGLNMRKAEKNQKKCKRNVTGPVTIPNWSFPREDISLKESAFQIALAIRSEVLDLSKRN